MPVTVTVNNIWSRISGISDPHVVDDLDRYTSFFVEGYQFTKAYRQGYFDKKSGQFVHWDGRRHLLTKRMMFPTGLLARVKEFLGRYGEEYVIVDKRPEIKAEDPLEIKHYTPRDYQVEAVAEAIKRERGIIRVGTGGGKCNRFGTPVLKYDGTVENVENIRVGDLLMGPDSKPRKVLSTTTGFGDIYKIDPLRGNAWYCNDVHVLTLKHTVTGEIVDIPLDEYLKKNKKFKHLYKQFSVGVNFPNGEDLPIDPYFLGVWFGDGSKGTTLFANGSSALTGVAITTMDEEVVETINEIANDWLVRIRAYDNSGKRCPTYNLVRKPGESNRLLEMMRTVVGPSVKIPLQYLTSSRQNRLQFLAGWVDSDGYLHHNGYEICQKRKDWAEAIAFVARSLGFRALIGEKYSKQYDRTYYRISISGDVSEVPVRIRRKKAEPRAQKKDACKTGFSVECVGKDHYAGFELSGDGRYLLGDFTVTHNTLIAGMLAAHYNIPTMVYVVGKDLLYQFHKELEKSLGVPIGMIGDGKCDIQNINVCSVWTAVTAFGVKSKISLDDDEWAPENKHITAGNKLLIKNAIEGAGLAIFDEAHFLATDTIQAIYKSSKGCRYMFGLSGTDWRDDGADILLESICGNRIYNMPSSKLIENGYLVPPQIVFFEVPPLPEVLPKHYASVYSKFIVNNDVRNELIVESARKLLAKNKKVLILVKHLNHGRLLSEMLSDIPLYFVSGEVDADTREDVKTSFEAGHLKCLIASSVFDIGVDIPSLDALILACGGKSTVRTLQRVGRVIRLFDDKKYSTVVDFIDNARYLDKHSAARIAVYESEPKFKIKLPKGFDSSTLKKPFSVMKKVS